MRVHPVFLTTTLPQFAPVPRVSATRQNVTPQEISPPTVAALVGIALEACEFHDRLTHDCNSFLVACDVAEAALDTWEHDAGCTLPATTWADLLIPLTRALQAEAAAEYHRRAAAEIAEAAEITDDDMEMMFGDWCRDGRGFGA